jgi:hypothetical protein
VVPGPISKLILEDLMRGKDLGKIVLALFTFVLLSGFGSKPRLGDTIRTMKAIGTFPTEEQINKNQVIFSYATKFAFSDQKVFVCDAREQAVSIFDMDGNFLKRFGKPGQGPGEFGGPVFISYFKGKVYVTDRGNLRIQTYSEDGIFEKAWNLLDFAVAPAITEDRMMVLSLSLKNEEGPIAPFLALLNLQGEVVKSVPCNLSRNAIFGEMMKDNLVVIRAVQKEFHLLQMYGDIYRIYDDQGNKLKQIVLERNPLKNRDREVMKSEYAYPTFDVDQGRIYAHRVAKGGIDVDVFDLTGKFVETYRCPLDKNEVYLLLDMKIIRRGGKELFYFLLVSPENAVFVAESPALE